MSSIIETEEQQQQNLFLSVEQADNGMDDTATASTSSNSSSFFVYMFFLSLSDEWWNSILSFILGASTVTLFWGWQQWQSASIEIDNVSWIEPWSMMIIHKHNKPSTDRKEGQQHHRLSFTDWTASRIGEFSQVMKFSGGGGGTRKRRSHWPWETIRQRVFPPTDDGAGNNSHSTEHTSSTTATTDTSIPFPASIIDTDGNNNNNNNSSNNNGSNKLKSPRGTKNEQSIYFPVDQLDSDDDDCSHQGMLYLPKKKKPLHLDLSDDDDTDDYSLEPFVDAGDSPPRPSRPRRRRRKATGSRRNNNETGLDCTDDDVDNDTTNKTDPSRKQICIGSIFGMDVGGTLAKFVYFEQNPLHVQYNGMKYASPHSNGNSSGNNNNDYHHHYNLCFHNTNHRRERHYTDDSPNGIDDYQNNYFLFGRKGRGSSSSTSELLNFHDYDSKNNHTQQQQRDDKQQKWQRQEQQQQQQEKVRQRQQQNDEQKINNNSTRPGLGRSQSFTVGQYGRLDELNNLFVQSTKSSYSKEEEEDNNDNSSSSKNDNDDGEPLPSARITNVTMASSVRTKTMMTASTNVMENNDIDLSRLDNEDHDNIFLKKEAGQVSNSTVQFSGENNSNDTTKSKKKKKKKFHENIIKSKSMLDMTTQTKKKVEALDRFYNFANKLDSYQDITVRDNKLSFYSRELGGQFHFIHFETRYMKNAMDLIRYNELHHNIVEMGATGGGAHKYADEFERMLGIRMDKQDELNSLVAGMQFVLSTVVGECYTFRPKKRSDENDDENENDVNDEDATTTDKEDKSSGTNTTTNTKTTTLTDDDNNNNNNDDQIDVPLLSKDDDDNNEQKIKVDTVNDVEDDDNGNENVNNDDDDDDVDKNNEKSKTKTKNHRGSGRSSGDEWWWSRKVQRDAISYSSSYPYMLVTIGTGVSILRVDGPRQHERVSGSTIGGGTYWGLIRLLTDSENFEDVMRMAEAGDTSKVDMLVGDIYGNNNDALAKLGLPSHIVASSFGKLVAKEDPASGLKQEDLARALLLMVTNNIGQVAYLNAKLYKTSRIYFVGNFLRHNIISQRRLSYAIHYWSKGEMEALFLEHEGYFGALGAFLMSQNIHSPQQRTQQQQQPQQQQKHKDDDDEKIRNVGRDNETTDTAGMTATTSAATTTTTAAKTAKSDTDDYDDEQEQRNETKQFSHHRRIRTFAT